MLHRFAPSSSRFSTSSVLGWVVTAAVAVVMLVVTRPVGLDLKVYREGARVLLESGDLYAPILGPVGDPGLPFTYPPIAAVLFIPLLVLPFPVAYALVTALSVALTQVVVRDLVDRLGLLGRHGWWGWVVPPLVLVTAPFRDTLTYGQINIVLLAACYLALTRCRHEWAFGVAVGLTAAIKLTPLALLLLPLVLWRWRVILAAALSFVLPQVLTLVLFPGFTRAYWSRVIWDPSRVGDVAYLDNLSLRGTLERLGAPGWAWVLGVGVVIAVSAAAIWVHRRGEQVALMGLAAGCMLLISPISWVHHFVWLPLILAAWLVGGRGRRGLVVCAGLLVVSLAINAKYVLWWLSLPLDDPLGVILAGAPAALILLGAGLTILAPGPGRSNRATPEEGTVAG